jgi:predicted ATPase
MEIKYIWISKYKNLDDIKFKFNTDLITLLVGQNGLGKSNLLEAIAIIFSNLDLAENVEEFTSAPYKDFFDFKIWYTCREIDIRIKAINSQLSIQTKNSNDDENAFQDISFAKFKRDRNLVIPDYIIGYYSGENSRIKEFFSRHSKQRISNLKKRVPALDYPALGKMFFTEETAGELLFFTLWVYKDSEFFGESIRSLLGELIDIESKSVVQISFNNPEFANSYPHKNADELTSNIQNKVENPFWGLTGKIDKLLQILYSNHTEHSIPRSFEDATFDQVRGRDGFVFFDHLDYSSLHLQLEEEFKDPIYLFDVLHAAHQMGIVYKIDGVISKNGAIESHNFRELSEGERQLLTVLGLILITGRDDCLFLLDEPDTHLNPKWQREYVRLLHEFDVNPDNSHIIVGTHSPLIVQASGEADIFLFRKNADGKIICDPNDFKIQNWRIDQVLVSDYFELPSARPPLLDNFMKIRERILSQTLITVEDEKQLEIYENEFGVFPTGESIEQIKAMLLFKSVAQKIKTQDDKDQKTN